MKTHQDRSLASEGAPIPEARPRRRRNAPLRARPGEAGGLGQALMSQSAAWTFLGLTLGIFVSRKFFILPVAVAVTLTQELAKKRLLPRHGNSGLTSGARVTESVAAAPLLERASCAEERPVP
jgi:hypothetical protein